ncbi:MAG: FAD-dependent thymidylate synthase, partial [Nitrososphaerota archaeon]
MRATLLNTMGDDLTVCDAARVSFNNKSEDYTEEQNHKLINYLAKHKHYSPFGHCFASFHVKAPIFVARQLVKHKFLRWNEISRRYVDDTPEFYVPEVWRGKAKNKKQGSEGKVSTCNTKALPLWHDDALKYYKMLLADGVAPEMAR